MKTIVAIIVYTRLENLQKWLRAWNMCDKQGADLYVIHNYDIEEHHIPFRQVCIANNVNYIPRKNIGMDIGAFQDICRERLEGFPNEWDYLFWCPDDTIPMSKRFLHHYLALMRRRSGVVCLEISNEIKKHIRTTAFMIDKEISKLIKFPSDPITTKQECYEFEHRSKDAFYEQMIRLHKPVVQVHPNLRETFLWDTHCRANLRRMKHHYNEFEK